MRATQLSRIFFLLSSPFTQPMADQELERGQRIEHVRLALAVPLRANLTAKRFGELVAEEEGRAKVYDKATPTRWELGAAPSIPAIEAMCRIARRYGLAYVSRTWLAFGDEGVAEAKQAPAAPILAARATTGAPVAPLDPFEVGEEDELPPMRTMPIKRLPEPEAEERPSTPVRKIGGKKR